MTEFSIWTDAPPWEPTAHADGDPSIRTAVAFYATTTTWWVTGARLRAPAGSALGTVTLSLYVTPNESMPDLADAPVASAQVAVGDGAGWYEARWPDAIELVAPDAAWICLESEAGDGYLFVSEATVGPDFIEADGGVDLYLAEALHPRSAFRVPPGSTTSSRAFYGVVPVVSDEPDGPTPSGGSVAIVTVGAVGSGLARRAGGSTAPVVVAATEHGRKRAYGGSSALVDVAAGGAGYDPGNVTDELPTTGTLLPVITKRGMVAITHARGLEPA